jgi:hypothetical protein
MAIRPMLYAIPQTAYSQRPTAYGHTAYGPKPRPLVGTCTYTCTSDPQTGTPPKHRILAINPLQEVVRGGVPARDSPRLLRRRLENLKVLLQMLVEL